MSIDNVSRQDAPPHGQDWQIGTYEWRPGADRLTWSPELVRIYGVDDPPSLEQGFSQLVHPEDRVRVEGETSAFLGSGVGHYSHTFRIVRPDGAVRVILDRGTIMRDEAGNARVIRGVNIDVTDEAHLNYSAEERLRVSEERYRTLFEAIDEGFCLIEVRFDPTDGRADYRVVEANPAFYERTGFPHAILGRWLREAAPQLEEHWYETYGQVAATGAPVRFEQGSDMLGRWFDVYAFRVDPPHDRRVAVLFNDISERKRHEEHVQSLMQEVGHRSKNMLSLVLAIARQTAQSGAGDFVDRFGERLQALAAGHDLLVHNAWRTVPLAELIRSQLAHFSGLFGDRIVLAGPPLLLRPDAAQALGMAFHELATNAAKYGALSSEAGRIAIDWSIEDDGPEVGFVLSWRERDGPAVVAPQSRGFGSKVTIEMVKASIDGEVSVDYAASGLAWRLSCPAGQILA